MLHNAKGARIGCYTMLKSARIGCYTMLKRARIGCYTMLKEGARIGCYTMLSTIFKWQDGQLLYVLPHQS